MLLEFQVSSMTCLVHPTPNYVITVAKFYHVSTTSMFQEVWGYMSWKCGNHSVFCYLLLLTSGNSTFSPGLGAAAGITGRVLLILSEVISTLIFGLFIVFVMEITDNGQNSIDG